MQLILNINQKSKISFSFNATYIFYIQNVVLKIMTIIYQSIFIHM